MASDGEGGEGGECENWFDKRRFNPRIEYDRQIWRVSV